ncbi:MAG: hypothetical protein J2P30_20760 [Actinobacteria bacterium]|nr:hypothetical protein [Actinomycetota bacterium]
MCLTARTRARDWLPCPAGLCRLGRLGWPALSGEFPDDGSADEPGAGLELDLAGFHEIAEPQYGIPGVPGGPAGKAEQSLVYAGCERLPENLRAGELREPGNW